MSTFICFNCGCIDNSACDNNYHTRWIDFYDKYDKVTPQNKNEIPNPLCTECSGNEWHNHFEKQHWTECGTKETLIEEAKRQKGNFENAVEYFESEETK